MRIEVSDRGFEVLVHEGYAPAEPARLAGQSSGIGEYEDAFRRPGSSFLWIGSNHHLNREQVKELTEHLTRWLETGSMSK